MPLEAAVATDVISITDRAKRAEKNEHGGTREDYDGYTD